METSEKIKYHSKLAGYFSSKPLFLDGNLQKKPLIRKCIEQPYQQTKAQLWDEVTSTLCNLDFIQAKAVAKMTYELVQDFNDVLELIPDNAENICQEKSRHARMDKYTRDLIAYAKKEIVKLEIPESITPWPQEKIDAEVRRLKNNPTRADRLKDFLNFLGRESGNLQDYAFEFSYFATQQVWNYAAEGPVGKAAEKATSEVYKSLLRRIPFTRPPWNPLPQELQILRGHTRPVNAVSITPDGKRAISCSDDNTCILWDLGTGKKLASFTSDSSIFTVNICPNGILLGSQSGEVVILNIDKSLLFTGTAITTARLIWDFELQKYQELSADCPMCGHRFAPPASILAAIETITKRAGLRPEQSPCLELPKEVWEEPELLGDCPKCSEKLKFNPFIAGGEYKS